MSDYIYSQIPVAKGKLADNIQSIYTHNAPSVKEFHGAWGSLAVSNNMYHGFLPYETNNFLMVVIGGPVLYFSENDFLVEPDSNTATKRIFQRWVIESAIQWDEDLSGPFTILLIDKMSFEIQVVTDLMAFIPIYIFNNGENVVFGTHVDAVAQACEQSQNYDEVSLIDFILSNVITFPYTAYKNIRQLPPSSLITIYENRHKSVHYWEPIEKNNYGNIKEAAKALREGISGYISRVTESMSHIAQFISAGEDSRALSGLLPSNLKRDGFIFLDFMNREGKIAKLVAEKYDVDLTIGFRGKTHYLDILPEASRLIGSGHQYAHAHSLGFNREYSLHSYPAVFGGYLSDSLLKGYYSKKHRGKGRFPFLPEFFRRGEDRTKVIISQLTNQAILDEIRKRRIDRYRKVEHLRPYTAHEWFVLWPSTMRMAIPNFYSTRRLFKSYEPFLCKESVKISASVPIYWKLNRRLFNRAMKPFLKPSRWIMHADGRLPYYSWWINIPIQFCVWFSRHVGKRIGLIKGNQGPWGDWNTVFTSQEYKKLVEDASEVNLDFLRTSLAQLLVDENVTKSEKINLLQVLGMYKNL